MNKEISAKVICIILVISMLFANFNFAFASSAEAEEDIGEIQAEDEEKPELFEKMFTLFVIVMGNTLKNLISIMILPSDDLSIDALVFDRFSQTKLTFFKNDYKYFGGENQILVDASDGINNIFGIFQKISATIYVVILVYMGIRVLLISTADKKAKFKALVFDWVKGMAILFLFPYAIRYAILLNHAIVTYIDDHKNGAIAESSPSIKNTGMSLSDVENEAEDTSGSDYMQVMYNEACKTKRLSRAICWFIMLVQMVQFWIVYIKRLIKVTFLIAIFPLVTISYAIDKIGDGKSQAFDHWWKEFLLEVFIQSFHAINYVVVMGLVFALDDNWFLAIIGITYVTKGADIIRSLFAQMKGGGAGGPMDLSKSLLKAGAIASGVKKLGGVARGMMNPINKGVGMVQLGMDKMLDARQRNSEAELDEVKRIRGETSTTQELIQKGANVTVKRSREENVTLLRSLENGELSDEEKKKLILKLGKMSQEDLETALGDMGSSDAFRGKVENLANLGFAATILTSQRKRAKNVDIQQSIDICMKNMTNQDATKLLKDLGLDSKGKLQSIAAQHSIALDESKRQERLQREASAKAPTTKEDKARRAVNVVMNGASGEYNLEELHTNADYLDDISKNGTDAEKKLVEDSFKDANYSLEQFKANLAVQTINYSDTIDEEHRQEYIDSAIDNLNAIKDDKKYSAILSNLETNVGVDKLQKGYIPIVTHQDYTKEQETDLRKEFRKLLNDGKVDLGEEFDVYRENYVAEASSEGKRNVALGSAEVGAGMVTTPIRAAVATATSFIATGVTASEKDDYNPIANAAVVAPPVAEMTDNIAKIGGNLFTRVVAKNGKTLEQQKKDLEVQRGAYKEGQKQYADQKELEYVTGVLNERQAEYDRMYASLQARLKKRNGK